jgi:CRP-like cAMP-binding protein
MVDIDLLLAWGATYKKYRTGEMIFYEGSEGRYYHQLVEGRVRWMNVDEDGREFIQKFIEEGESFGEIPMFDDGPYVSNAIADKDTIVIRLPKGSFLQLLSENPVLHFSFTRLITERLRNKFIMLKEVASQDPERKVVTILDEYKKGVLAGDSSDTIRINLTRQEIADMTGLRVETVIRTIKHLEEKGILAIEKGKVYIRS